MKPTAYTYEGDLIQADMDDEALAINFSSNGVTLYFFEDERETILNELEELVKAFK